MPRAALVAAVFVLVVAMDYVYVVVLVGVYGDRGYPGYPFAHNGTGVRVFCWAIAVAPALWMPIAARRPSQVLTWCIYLLVVMPTAVVGVYALQPPREIVAMMFSVTAGLLVLNASALLPPLRVPAVRADRLLFWTTIVVISIAAYVITLRTYGATIRFVTIDEVYEQRAAFVEVNAGPLARYLMSWQAQVINPLLMAIAIARKRPLLFLVAAAGQVFFFAVAAQRVLFVTPFLVLGMHFLLRRRAATFALRATVGAVVAFFGPVLLIRGGEFLQGPAVLVFQVVLIRMFLNNGFLAVVYFRYFHVHPHVGFAEMKPLNLFLTSPYKEHYPVALSYDLWGRYSDPNANLFADGFAQLGYPGVVIEALALAVMFWLLDSIARQRGLSVWLVAMICSTQISALANTASNNIILGAGFGVLLMLLALLPESDARAGQHAGRKLGWNG